MKRRKNLKEVLKLELEVERKEKHGEKGETWRGFNARKLGFEVRDEEKEGT